MTLPEDTATLLCLNVLRKEGVKKTFIYEKSIKPHN